MCIFYISSQYRFQNQCTKERGCHVSAIADCPLYLCPLQNWKTAFMAAGVDPPQRTSWFICFLYRLSPNSLRDSQFILRLSRSTWIAYKSIQNFNRHKIPFKQVGADLVPHTAWGRDNLHATLERVTTGPGFITWSERFRIDPPFIKTTTLADGSSSNRDWLCQQKNQQRVIGNNNRRDIW